jgi:hypothetical protein
MCLIPGDGGIRLANAVGPIWTPSSAPRTKLSLSAVRTAPVVAASRRYESSLRFDPPRLSQTSMPSALEWLSSLLATLCLLGACRQLCIPRLPGD